MRRWLSAMGVGRANLSGLTRSFTAMPVGILLALDSPRSTTLKGAFLITWAAVWPISSIRKMLQWRKGERILSDLEAQGVACTLLERDDRPRIPCPAYVSVSDDGIN